MNSIEREGVSWSVSEGVYNFSRVIHSFTAVLFTTTQQPNNQTDSFNKVVVSHHLASAPPSAEEQLQLFAA